MSLEKSRLLVYRTLVYQVSSYRAAIGFSDFLNETDRKHESPIRVPETPSAFHPGTMNRFSVAAMCINKPDRPAVRINR
jgi:hypothetical protein